MKRAQKALGGLLQAENEARHAVRVVAASLLAFTIYQVFKLPQGYWAVFTVVIVMQGSIGGTLSASTDRMKGTFLGALVGGFCAWLHPTTAIGLGVAFALAVGVTTFFAALRPSLKVAPVTAVIMLISPSAGHAGPLTSALYRVVEIAMGSVIGVLATYLIFPARSNTVVAARAMEVLQLMATSLEGYIGAFADPPRYEPHDAAQLAIRAGLSGFESAMQDVDRERASRLGAHRLSDALPRTLWRVRNDGISVSRALAPLPTPVSGVIGDSLEALMRSEASLMRRCGQALCTETIVDRGDQSDRLRTFEEAMGRLRRSHVTDELSFEAVGRLFGLTFALESLHRNLFDLADRIDEAARAPEV